MKFSILDQSPVSEAGSARQAVDETLNLVCEAEARGYYRYWVAEHHNTRSFASASPEILMGRIASITERIRVGSGGVLLGHYAPLKVAEQFRMLETLFPGRIDMGLGRAGGSDKRTVKALQSGVSDGSDAFARVDELLAYLQKSAPQRSDYNEVHAAPAIDSIPEPWILGTSPASARYAAERGLRYSFGSFINAEHCITALQTYHQHFRPSAYLQKPYSQLAVFALCAESEREAQKLAGSTELWLVQSFVHGRNIPFPPAAKAAEYRYGLPERFVLDMRRQSAIIGNPAQVAERFALLARQLAVDEFAVVTITERYEDRLASYRLLAEALGLETLPVADTV